MIYISHVSSKTNTIIDTTIFLNVQILKPCSLSSHRRAQLGKVYTISNTIAILALLLIYIYAKLLLLCSPFSILCERLDFLGAKTCITTQVV